MRVLILGGDFLNNIPDVLVVIPELFLYFVPGYIAFKIKERYGLKKNANSLDTVLYSIVYSFVVQIIFTVITHTLTTINSSFFSWLGYGTVIRFSYLLLAVFVGLFLVKMPKTIIGKGFGRLFNRKLVASPNVWVMAMENKGWAIVYLKNNLVYRGKLINYTSNPNDDLKELLLTSYTLCVQNTDISNTDEFLTVIEDNSNNSSAKVLLERSNILSIEVIVD